jgi:hypothetical protein
VLLFESSIFVTIAIVVLALISVNAARSMGMSRGSSFGGMGGGRGGGLGDREVE